jgi:sulfoxide reductase heme-binding subunit YedZ
MSSRTTSQKSSFPWFNLLVIILGLSVISAFTVVGVVAVANLSQYLPLTSSKAYWFISRSSGVLAYMLLTLAVMWGLVQSGAILRPTIPPALALGLHSFLNWSSLAMVALHGLILLGDSFIKMTLADIFIPLLSPYRPLAVGLGVLGVYLMLMLALSFYARRWLGQKTFRTLHYASFLTYLLVSLHGLTAGSDTYLLWPLYLVSIGSVSLLIVWRVANSRRTAAVRSGRS